MKSEIEVHCDGNWDKPQVQIGGSAKALADFGMVLNGVKELTTLETPDTDDEFYPVTVNRIVIEPVQSGNDRLTVTIDENEFRIIGTTKALNLLGDSLLNFDEFDEDAAIPYHFHLDYYEGNDVLNETNCSLIFSCDRKSE